MRVLSLLVLGWLLAASSARGSVLVEYDFTNEPGDQAFTAPSFVASGLAVSNFRRGFGGEPQAWAGAIAARGWAGGQVEAGYDYFEFVITPLAGAILDINEIAFAERRNATGIREFTIRSSLDDYRTDVITPVVIPDDGLTRNHQFALGAAFDAIATAVTFRIYGYFTEAFQGRWAVANHEELGAFRVSGTISGLEPEPGPDPGPEPGPEPGDRLHTPEPAAITIWGVAACFGVVGASRRRLRRKSGR